MVNSTVLHSKSLTEGMPLAARQIKESFQNWEAPQFFLQFGPGFELDGLFDQSPQNLAMQALSGMPAKATPDGIQPQLLYGHCLGLPILAAHGHRHLCEGYGIYPCVLPLAAANCLGIKNHIYIDCGISLRSELKVGSWALLTDYLNGHAFSPLDGHHDLLPEIFPDMSYALSQAQNAELVNAFFTVGINPRLCTYLSTPGFHFCSPAEAALARNSGADLLGHDLVMEIILAHAMGCQVSALVLSGSLAPDKAPTKVYRRQDMLDTCRYCSAAFIRGLKAALPEFKHDNSSEINLPDSDADTILRQSITAKSTRKSPLRLYRPDKD